MVLCPHKTSWKELGHVGPLRSLRWWNFGLIFCDRLSIAGGVLALVPWDREFQKDWVACVILLRFSLKVVVFGCFECKDVCISNVSGSLSPFTTVFSPSFEDFESWFLVYMVIFPYTVLSIHNRDSWMRWILEKS